MALNFTNSRPKQIGLWLLFSALLALAITRQSLWMDEGATVWFASHKSIVSFFSALIGVRGAPGDAQMLFYLLYMWGWVKLWGTSELALRAANIPFAIVLVAAVCWASATLFRRPHAWMLLSLSPFVWFYMNEARPYMAVMSFSAVAIVAVLAYLMDHIMYRVFAPWCCLVALLLAWGSHIVAAFLFPSLVFLIAATAKQDPALRQGLLKDWLPASLFCLPGFVALGTFYFWTSTYGMDFTSGRPGWANLAFVLYEFLGFAGLGPPRNELRERLQPYMAAHYWPSLLICGAVAVAVGWLWSYARPNRIARNLAGSFVVGIAIALTVSRVAHLRLLGRHVAMFFPMLLILFLLWANTCTFSGKARYIPAALTAVAIIWGISDARLVLLPRYAKDSYRAASSISMARARLVGGDILWAADPRTAYYYGVRAARRVSAVPGEKDVSEEVTWPVYGQAINGANWTVGEAAHYLNFRTKPTILVLSRPDLFDLNGAWRILVETQRPNVIARLNGLWIYEWPPREGTTNRADFQTPNGKSDSFSVGRHSSVNKQWQVRFIDTTLAQHDLLRATHH